MTTAAFNPLSWLFRSGDGRGASYPELAIILGAYVLLVIPVPGLSSIRLLSLAALLPFAYVHRRAVWTEWKRLWVAMILPFMLALSLLWTPEKMNGAEFVVNMTLGFLAIAYTVARLTVRQLIMLFFLCFSFAAVASYISPNAHILTQTGETAELGLYSQKNMLGKRMMFLAFLASFVIVTPGYWRAIRVAAVGMLILALALVIASNSVTAIVLAVPGSAAILGGYLLAQAVSKLKGGMTLAVILVCLLPVVGLLGFSLAGVDPYQWLLESFDKSESLTGRTLLWDIATQYISEHPWLGSGVEGFWRPQQPEAVWMATKFGGVTNFRFYFHNSFYEYGVHLGIPAVIALAFTCLYMAWVSLRDFLIFKDGLGCLVLIVTWLVLVRNLSASDFYTKADPNVMLTWVLIGYALQRYAKRKRAAAVQTAVRAPEALIA